MASICDECGAEFPDNRRRGAHITNVHRQAKRGRPRKLQPSAQPKAIEYLTSEYIQPQDNISSATTSNDSGKADSILGNNLIPPQPRPSVKEAPPSNPYVNPDGSFNDSFIPPAFDQPQPPQQPQQPQRQTPQPPSLQPPQQPQQPQDGGPSWKDLAMMAVGLGQRFVESRVSKVPAAPDPFSMLGQAAFAKYMATFSGEAGKATGKMLGKRVADQEISNDQAAAEEAKEIVEPNIGKLFAGMYSENESLKKKLAEIEAKLSVPNPQPAEFSVPKVEPMPTEIHDKRVMHE